MTTDVDVLVVGGGPVGLAASIEARLAGLTVAVIEPRDVAIDKACGEGLMPGALPLLDRLGVDPPGWPLLGVSYRDGRSWADHRFRTGPGRGVRRTVLHAALSARAEELGVVRVNGKVVSIVQDEIGVTALGVRAPGAETFGSGVVGSDAPEVGALRSGAAGIALPGAGACGADMREEAAGARDFELRSRWLFGCDGLHSTVRREVGLELPARRAALAGRSVPNRRRVPESRAAPDRRRVPPDRARFGLRQHFFVEPWSDLIEVHWSDRAEAYVTPVSENVVGIAMLGPRLTDFAQTLAGIPELADRVRGAEPASTLRGAGPFRQRASGQVAGRVLLVGDASGYVDAITGEGLRLGFDQARAAVAAVVADRVADYPRAWRRVTRDFRVLTTGLVTAANSPLRNRIVPTASRLPRLYGSIVERLAR